LTLNFTRRARRAPARNTLKDSGATVRQQNKFERTMAVTTQAGLLAGLLAAAMFAPSAQAKTSVQGTCWSWA
jgi:hypothetical protein